MLQNFRDRIRNSRWLGYGIVIAIAIPFAVVGIEAYLQGGGGEVAAEVNGTPIQSANVEQQVSQRRAQLRQQFGGELPRMFSEGMLRRQVLEQLITQEVLRQVATEARMRIGSEQLAARIRQQQFFHRNGQFDPELYRRALRQAGMTPQVYEAQVRQALRVQHLRNGVGASAFVLSSEAQQAARLQRQERQVGVLEFPRSRAAKQVSVPTEDVRSYYETHRDRFQTPPQVRVAYLELDLAALAERVEVTEDEVRAEYRGQQQRRAQEAERRAAHLLIEVPEDASQEQIEAARQEAQRLRDRLIGGGVDFAALARQHSDDPGSAQQGGELGWVKRGTMVPPFEQALFGLEEPGAVSEPIRTGYGFHLIKLLETRGAAQQSFAEAREAIEQRIRRRKAQSLFRDRVEVLRNTAYENPGSLKPAAEATGLQIRRSEWFSRREGDGIAQAKAVREAAFQPDVREQGLNSGLLELNQRRVAVLRVIDQQSAQARPLAEVRQQVRDQVRQRRIDRILAEWADGVGARLAQGRPPAELAGNGVRYRDLGWIRREADVDAAIASTAFELSPPQADAPAHRGVRLGSGDQAVVILRDARLPEVKDAAVAEARTQQRRSFASAETSAWAQGLRAAAEITRPR